MSVLDWTWGVWGSSSPCTDLWTRQRFGLSETMAEILCISCFNPWLLGVWSIRFLAIFLVNLLIWFLAICYSILCYPGSLLIVWHQYRSFCLKEFLTGLLLEGICILKFVGFDKKTSLKKISWPWKLHGLIYILGVGIGGLLLEMMKWNFMECPRNVLQIN